MLAASRRTSRFLEAQPQGGVTEGSIVFTDLILESFFEFRGVDNGGPKNSIERGD